MNDQDLRDFKWYTGNLAWLKDRTIVLGRTGSHAYGTNLPTSDQDIKGVCYAPLRYYLGFLDTFQQAETKSPLDCTVYDIRKFFELATDCNPNIIEQLFLAEDDILLRTYAWDQVLASRQLFLSQKARHTFTGYAAAQMKRIRTHRRWLLNPPKGQPQREDYGLKSGSTTLGKEEFEAIEAQIRKQEDVLGGKGLRADDLEAPEFQESLVTNVVTKLNITAGLIPIIIAERRYRGACKQWSQYQTWKKERNPRRQELEAKFGYDTKHGMHLVRLLRMGHEIITGQGVIVKRPDAAELLSIRAGAWTFERMETFAADMDASIVAAAATSPLPHDPDRKAIDKVLVYILENLLTFSPNPL